MGSEDYKIRAFQNEDLLYEVSETGKISSLTELHGNKFIFALDNGSCGVYAGKKRLWRYKGKCQATSILGCVREEDNTTRAYAVIGWENGTLEVSPTP